MNRFFRIVSAGVLTVLAGATRRADEFLGSYVARISEHDKQASDGYPLDTAAQMVRQDRANFHKFHDADPDDENDVWFRTNDQRARLERMLGQGGAMSRVDAPGDLKRPAAHPGRRLPQPRRSDDHRLTLGPRGGGRRAPLCSPCDLGEIGDLAGRGADARQQRQPIGAHGGILVVYEHMFEE